MAGSEVFQLAILLTLKDAASGGLDRWEARLRSAGKAGEQFHSKFENIRKDLGRDIAIGGIGLGSLKVLKDGVQAAADYQTVMTDLKATMATVGKDGQTDLTKLAQDMLRAEAIAVRLGNKLPGTTGDFAEMMQVMKQNGLQSKTIFDGAADAVANLAVSSKSVPKEIAADLAQFGNLFGLETRDEWLAVADTFSRVNTFTGQTATELVEAAKYFQGRAGQGLGLKGAKDAEEISTLFGLLGKKGIRGSMAGTELTDFFSEYLRHGDKVKELKSQTGIDLNLFDKKGKFVGLDETFRQMEQFRKLSDEQKLDWNNKIFGVRGGTIANQMTEEGTEGWKKFNAEKQQTIALDAKVKMTTETYNAQMEALEGTLTNLKVSVFETMLPGLTSVVDKANLLAGSLQEFAKAHPEIAKGAIEFIALGSAVMVGYSAAKTLTNGVRLFKLMSAFSKGEGLAGYLTHTASVAETTTSKVSGLTAKERALQQLGGTVSRTDAKVDNLSNSVVAADKKVGGLRKNLFSLDNVFKAVLVLEAVNFTWDQISGLRKTLDEWKSLNQGLNSAGQQSAIAYQGMPADQKNPKAEAFSVKNLLEQGSGQFTKAIDPSRRTWTDSGREFFKTLFGQGGNGPLYENALPMSDPRAARFDEIYRQRITQYNNEPVPSIFSSGAERARKENLGAQFFMQRAPALADPAVMRSFRKDAMPTMNLSPEMTQHVDKMLQLAFPESFNQSLSGITEQGQSLAQALSSLQQPVLGTAELFTGLPQPIGESVTSFGNLPQPLGETNTQFMQLPAPLGQTNDSFVAVNNSARPLPGAFNNIFTSASSVSESLQIVSTNLANWRPPAAPAVPGSPAAVVTPPGLAVGGSVSRSGLAYIHTGEEVVPARARTFRDSYSSNLVRTMTEIRERETARPSIVNLAVQAGTTSGDTTSFIRSLIDASRFSNSVSSIGMDRQEANNLAGISVLNPPALAVGGGVTHSGLAYIHTGEEVVPAQAKTFREKYATNLLQSLVEIRERDSARSEVVKDVSNASESSEVSTIARNIIEATRSQSSINNHVLDRRAESDVSKAATNNFVNTLIESRQRESSRLVDTRGFQNVSNTVSIGRQNENISNFRNLESVRSLVSDKDNTVTSAERIARVYSEVSRLFNVSHFPSPLGSVANASRITGGVGTAGFGSPTVRTSVNLPTVNPFPAAAGNPPLFNQLRGQGTAAGRDGNIDARPQPIGRPAAQSPSISNFLSNVTKYIDGKQIRDITSTVRQLDRIASTNSVFDRGFTDRQTSDSISGFKDLQRSSELKSFNRLERDRSDRVSDFSNASPAAASGGVGAIANLMTTAHNAAPSLSTVSRETIQNHVGKSARASESKPDNDVHIHYSPNLTVNGGGPAAAEEFQAKLDEHARHIGRLVKTIMQNGRVRN